MKHTRFVPLFAAILAMLLAVFALAAEYDPYVLNNNSSYNGGHEGIWAGWTLDNRAGNPRGLTGGYESLVDVSDTRASALYRDITRVDEGIVTFETRVRFTTGFDGFALRFTDDTRALVYELSAVDGYFAVKDSADASPRKLVANNTPANSTHLFVKLDFDGGTAETFINGTSYGTVPLLSDNILRYGFYSSKEDTLTAVFSTARLLANYTIFDDFLFTSNNKVPFGWNSSSQSSAYVSNGAGLVKNGAALYRTFPRMSAKNAFEATVILDSGANIDITFTDGTKNVLKFTSTRDTNYTDDPYVKRNVGFYMNGNRISDAYNGMTNNQFLESFWYRVRFETDFENHTVAVKINGREMANILLDESLTGFDKVSVTGKNGTVRFDDVRLFHLVDHDDYVPAPVIPEGDDYVVGMNVCSLWSYTSSHGWSCISPYPENRPVLGYYDEGVPETADWEIKFIAEHGIDFQAFCWYADQAAAPQQGIRNSIHLHHGFMNAKYSYMTKYAILWEASNGAHPTSSEVFRKYFIPAWIENYFKDSRYMVIDNKPVLMCFGYSRFITDIGGVEAAKAEIDYLREEVRKIGYDDLILIASHNAPSASICAASGVDAACAYNWGTSGYDLAYTKSRIQQWTNAAVANDTYQVPTLSVGFNSLAWHGTRYPNMSVSDYNAALDYIKDEYLAPSNDAAVNRTKDWQKNFMILSTWNEYGEGTYIMPAEKLNGFGYLDAVRDHFTENNVPHNDVIPTDAQRFRINKNYPQYLHLLRRQDSGSQNVGDALISSRTVAFDDLSKISYGYMTDAAVRNGAFTGKSLVSTSNSYTGGIYTESLAFVQTKGNLHYKVSNVNTIKVALQVSKDTTVKIYYATDEYPAFHASRFLTVNATASDSVGDYFIPANTLNNQTIRALRVEFCANVVNAKNMANFNRVNGVEFALESIEFLRPRRLFIDYKEIESQVFSETRDGRILFPFDPKQVMQFMLNVHFEWDQDEETLTLYSPEDDDVIVFKTGESVMHTTKNGDVPLDGEIYLADGLPMLDLEALCTELGYAFIVNEDGDVYVETDGVEANSFIYNRPENLFDFQYNSLLGFSGNAVVVAENGCMNITATDNDPRIVAEGLSVEAKKYRKIEVCLSYDLVSGGDIIGFYWITNNDKTWSEDKHTVIRYPSGLNSGGEFVTFTLDVYDDATEASDHGANWKDTVTAIRFDPFSRTGDVAHVKYIKLIEDPDNAAAVSLTPDEQAVLFTSAAFDAEDGEMPFTGGGATVEIVEDPEDPDNHVYCVTPTGTGNRYVFLNYDMFFVPGVKYRVSYRVRAGDVYGGDGTATGGMSMHTDPRYDDPSQYIKSDGNYYDHILTANGLRLNEDGWKEVVNEFTVHESSFIRSYDCLHLYSNPAQSLGTQFYVDDLTILKVEDDRLRLLEAVADDGGVTVTGTAGKAGAGAVVVAAYDVNGRLLAAAVTDKKDFTVTLSGVENATVIRAYAFLSAETLIPLQESAEKRIFADELVYVGNLFEAEAAGE